MAVEFSRRPLLSLLLSLRLSIFNSATAAIGWRVYRAEYDWLAELFHMYQSVQASPFL